MRCMSKSPKYGVTLYLYATSFCMLNKSVWKKSNLRSKFKFMLLNLEIIFTGKEQHFEFQQKCKI